MNRNIKVKIISTLILIVMLISNILEIFPLLQSFATDIGDNKNIVSIGTVDYHLKSHDVSQGSYVITHLAGYYDGGTFYPAYCLQRNRDGAGIDGLPSYDVNINNILKDDETYNKIWRVIVNGYPYRTPESMGLSDWKYAYQATKMAVYCVIGQARVDEYYADDDIAASIISAIRNLVNIGESGTETYKTTLAEINEVDKIKLEGEYYVQNYKLTSNLDLESYTVSIADFPNGTILSDSNGNAKSTFNSGETFQVKIPKNEFETKNVSGKIRASIKTRENAIFYGYSSDTSRQDYALTSDPIKLNNLTKDISIKNNNGKIKVYKYGADQTCAISGVTFELIKDGSVVQTATTDASGVATFSDLFMGTYIVKEKGAARGYLLNTEEQEIEISYNEEKQISMSNQEPTGEIEFKKVNENGDGLAGVEFELFADEDIKDPTGNKTYYTKDQKIRSIITGADGVGRIDGLKLGRYYIKEFATPNGYLANNRKYTFSIDYVDENTANVFVDVGEIINYEPTGKITVIKTNKNGDKVPNAKFTVTAAEDIKNKLGTVTYFHAGGEVGTIENTQDGTGTLENLHLGKYLVTENYAPTGYLLNEESKEVELKYADENTALVFDSTTIINDEPTGVIDVKKADVLTGNGVRPDGTYHHGDATFSGAEYTLYANDKITNYAKTVNYYNKDDEIAKFTFDATGTPTVKILNNADGVSLSISGSKLKGLPMGSYYLRETELPKSGYLPDTTTYNFSVDYIDQYTADIDVSQTVKEQVERAKFELIKVSTDMNQVAPVVDKAQFTAILEKYVKYYGSFDEAYEHINEFTEDEWCTFETDLDGHGISDFLAYGKYVVSETYVPDSDINRVEEFTVTIDENSDGPIKEVIANDSPFTAYIKMVKKDKKTGKVVTYSNATFELYKYDRATREWNLVQCKVGSKYYREWTTDDEGKCETETTLDAGTYRLVEKVIPQGFNELEDNLIFYVNSANESVEYDLNWDAWITVEVENEQPTGRLIIDKSVILKEDVDKSLIDTRDLSSIKFRLKANEDIIDYADGSIIYKKGELIGEYNVDADGDLQIAELPMGSYTLQEISFLDGTVINSEIYEVNFEQTDTKTKEYVIEKNIENQTTLVEISKTDITGDKELVGAKLTVTDENNEVIDSWVSTEKSHKIEGLTVGKEYTLTEEIAPDEFVKASSIKFKVENTGEVQKVTMIDKQVIMSKEDIGGEEIEGAKLRVLDKDGNIVDSWTSTKESHKIKGLSEGETYTLYEDYAPDGFTISSKVEFTVTTDKETQEVKMIDKRVSVKKTDFVTGEEIEGAELEITDKDGNVIDSWTSTKEEHFVNGLVEGETYTLTEKTCPYGYEIAESIEFTVSEDKQTQLIEMKDMPQIRDIKIIKVDSDTKETIKDNFTFGIYEDENCTKLIKEVDSNKDDGSVIFEDLHYGTYFIKEIKAPKGYKLSDKVVKVELNDKGVFVDEVELEVTDGIYSFTFENEKLPEDHFYNIYTGSEINYQLLFTLIGISLIGIIAGIELIKKNKLNDKK